MGYWKKHPRKDLEAVLVEVDALGWRIEDPPTYYKVKCECGSHKRNIHLTPSDPNYGRNALKWVKRQDCMKVDETTEEVPDDLR